MEYPIYSLGLILGLFMPGTSLAAIHAQFMAFKTTDMQHADSLAGS
jgi:hypothetical protein